MIRSSSLSWSRPGAFLLAAAIPLGALAAPPPDEGGRGGRRRVQPPTVTSAGVLPDYCLSPNAAQLLRRCPEGVDPAAMQGVQAGAAPEAAATSGRQQERGFGLAGAGPTGPGIAQRPDDPRRRVQEQRIDNLIRQEIEATQRLLRTTPDTDPDKPDIYFRLAQIFYEMQDNRNFQAGQLDQQAMMIEEAEPNRATEMYQRRDALRQEALQWSDKAIDAYKEIIRAFRDWHKIDEALFYLAFAFEGRARDTDDLRQRAEFNRMARTVYEELIRQHSGSPYVANAYLSFAEYYFGDEGNMVRALEYYEKILRIPGTRIYGYALYKKAWTLYNLQEFQKALQAFEDVITYANQNPGNPDSSDLRRTARLELVQTYAQTGRSDQAWRYFERVGGDLNVAMMRGLATYYYSQGQFDDAVIAYQTLMDKDRNSDKLCDYQYWVTHSRMAQATTVGGVVSQDTKQAVIDEIKNMVEIWKLFVVRDGARQPPDAVKACTWWAADFVVDTAVRWHREAAGSDQQPGTNDRRTMEKAAVLYQVFVENFGDPNSPYFYDRLEPPPDWEYQNPYSVYKARYYAAELLWKSEKWEECGRAFDAVVEANPTGEYAQEAAFASVLCYKKQYDQIYQARDRVLARDTGASGAAARVRERERGRVREGREGVTWEDVIPERRELSPQEQSMAQAFERYICYVSAHEDLANVKFNRAFLYLDANQWAEAAVLFKDLAASYGGATDSDDKRVGVLSMLNYFEIVVRLNRAGVTQCVPEILDATTKTLETGFPSAADAGVLENNDERASLTTFLGAVPVFHCQQMLLQVKAFVDQRKWEDAANLALKIHDEYPEKYPGYRCLDPTQQSMMDDILNEAANYFEAANKIGRAIQLRDRLVRDYPRSEHVANAQYSVAAAYARLAFFIKAAQAYEAFARNYRSDERAPEAMLNAVQIRIGLGHDAEAKTDADFLDSTFGSNRKYQRKAAEAYFSIGERYVMERQWTDVVSHYEEYLRKYGRKGGKEFEVRATMLIAQAYWERSECPAEPSDRERTICRTNRNKAYEFAAKANGLVSLPDFSSAAAAAEGEQEDPVAVLAARRRETWNALVAALDIEVEGETEEQKQAMIFVRADKVADALGRARFYVGEKLYEQFMNIAWPEFKPDDWDPRRESCSQFVGSREYMGVCLSMERYKMWTEKKFVPFVQARDAKIREARAFYDSIAYLQVPAWEIAAASRVGDMYLQFWKDMYAAPTPPAFQREEFVEVEQAYREQLDNQAEPFKQHAIDAYGYCLMTATREQWFNRYSQRCEAALYEINPAEYRVSDEVYARPVFNRVHYAPAPLDLDILRTTNDLGETVWQVDVVQGAPTMNDLGRYRFHPAPAAPPQPPPASAAPPAAAAR